MAKSSTSSAVWSRTSCRCAASANIAPPQLAACWRISALHAARLCSYHDISTTVRSVHAAVAQQSRASAIYNVAACVLQTEPTVLKLKAPIKIFGDLHGQFGDLMRLFQEYGMPSTAGDITYIDYLFLGDYVDRGAHSLETICLLLALKIEYPRSIHLLRGNHEAADINALFGFRMECMERMGEYGVFIWQRINQVCARALHANALTYLRLRAESLALEDDFAVVCFVDASASGAALAAKTLHVFAFLTWRAPACCA